MAFIRISLAALAFCASAAAQAQSQEGLANGGQAWSLGISVSRIRADLANGAERSLSLRHYGEFGSVAFEALNAERFGRSDRTWAIDAYPRLWQGAYANVRYQYASTPALYPKDAWRAELYQSLGSLELAASRDEMDFASKVRIDGLALGAYLGNFYLRWRHQNVQSVSSSGNGDRLLVRWYYRGDADSYVEANAAHGRSDELGTALAGQSYSNTRGLVWTSYLDRDWGWRLSWTEARTGASGRERNLGLGLTRRW